MITVCYEGHHLCDGFDANKGWHNSCAVCEVERLQEQRDDLLTCAIAVSDNAGATCSDGNATKRYEVDIPHMTILRAAITKAKGTP